MFRSVCDCVLWYLCRGIISAGAFIVMAVFLSWNASAATPPRAALKYRDTLIRESRFVWGLNAPTATFAGQIHQESGWNPNAKSAFASGLTQFTPETADWIAGAYPKTLGQAQPLNPDWAIRALVTYDYRLWNATSGWADDCSRMAAALAGYNGGPGWITRDRALAKKSGTRSDLWFGAVERHNAGRAPAAFKENRDYPVKILVVNQPIYTGWGVAINCKGVQ